jgi:hypothetical protein
VVGLCRPGTSKMVVVFELRILRPVKEGTAGKLLRGFEPMVKGMRGLGRWAMVAWSSDRSEVVLQVVAERNIARVDNAFASWRRVIARAFGVEVKRGVWLAGYFADVRPGDVFEVACAERRGSRPLGMLELNAARLRSPLYLRLKRRHSDREGEM